MNAPRLFNECRECGEINRRFKRRCTVCGAELDVALAAPDEPALPPPPPLPPTREDQDTVLVMIVAVAVVWIGLTLAAPGLGIFLAILSVVPFLRTLAVVRRRADHGAQTSWMTSVVMFLGSLGVTLVLLAVVLVTAVGTFCAACLTGAVGAAAAGGRSMEGVVAVSALISLVAVSGVTYVLIKWIRKRWQRDVGDIERSR